MPFRMVVDQNKPKYEPEQTEQPEYIKYTSPTVSVPHQKTAQLHGSNITDLRA